MRYTIGLDVHKRETQACIANEDGEVLEEKRFRTSEKSYRRALKKYDEADVILDTVGFYRPVARWLDGLGYEVHLAHLGRVPKARVKTDRKDARRLLTLWRGDALPEAYLPPEEVQRQRDIARHRQFLGKESRRLKGKLKHDLYQHGYFVDENLIETHFGKLKDLALTRSDYRDWHGLKKAMQDAMRWRNRHPSDARKKVRRLLWSRH